MPRSSHAPTVAFMEEADEDSGSSVEIRAGTRVYASRDDSPKERPNTGKYRKGDGPDSPPRRSPKDKKGESRKEREPRPYGGPPPRESGRHERRESEAAARRMRAEAKADRDSAKALKNSRPQSLRHANTQPIVQQSPSHRRAYPDGPGHYGPPQSAPSSSRPRANSRPASYYAGQMGPPPPVNPAWQQGPMAPPTFVPGSPYDYDYAQSPMMMGGPPMPVPGMHGGMPAGSPGGPGFYDMGPPPSGPPPVQARDLRSRFEPRPSSAMGYSSTPSRNHPLDDYGEFAEYREEAPYGHQRRPSRSHRPQALPPHDEDRKRMPPPDFKPQRMPSMPRRPSTTANTVTPFQPPPPRPSSRHQSTRPPPPSHRRSVGFAEQSVYDEETDEDDLLTHEDLFHDSPEPSYHAKRRSMSRGQRGSFATPAFDDDDLDGPSSQPLARRRSRRGSTYGGPGGPSAALGSGGVSLTDDGNRYMDAVRYQEDVSGGPPVPLTAESLRKANKRDGVASSRSTRSSASRDDSEHKRSNTTGLTRSSGGAGGPPGDDFTIKVSGAAVVRVNGAEIECENSEITFSNPGGGARLGPGDGDSLYELEDDRSRAPQRKALPLRPRAPSQADSQRGYLPGYAPYEHAPYEQHAPYDQYDYDSYDEVHSQAGYI